MKTIRLALDDTVLSALIREQLAHLPHITIHDDEKGAADIVIARTRLEPETPHLLLGGKPEENTEFLPLPIKLGEMLDRLRYLLSGRSRFADQDILTFGDFSLNPEDSSLTRVSNGASVRLTDKEKLIILFLYEAPDKSLGRTALLQQVWGYAETAETHTLETHLYRLRQKLEEGLNATNMIVTKDGIYSLMERE